MPTRFALLTTPGFAIAMVVMLLNDLVLKAAFHNAVTGKLSDFSGVFVFCLFLVACCPRYARCGCLFGALFFAWWKTPWSAPVISAWNQLGWWPVARVQDWSDILAVAMAPLAWAYALRARPIRVPQLARLALAACSLAVFMGQSVRENPDSRVVADRYFIAPGSVGDLVERGLPDFVHAYYAYFRRDPSLNVWLNDGGYHIGATFDLTEDHGVTILRFSETQVCYEPITTSDVRMAAPIPPDEKIRRRAACMEAINRWVMVPLGAHVVLLEP